MNLIISGHEKDAFDFIPLIRSTLRKAGNYVLAPKIVHEITASQYWQSVEWITRKLSEYFTLTIDTNTKEPKQRKKRKPMTEEQLQAARERLVKARSARGKNKGL